MQNPIFDLLVSSVCPELANARSKLAAGELSFVHYTSAESAYAMLSSESVFLRNVRYMNDWQEVDYGRNLLLEIYHSEIGFALKAAMNKIDVNFQNDFESQCNSLIQGLERNAYIMSISEHSDD